MLVLTRSNNSRADRDLFRHTPGLAEHRLGACTVLGTKDRLCTIDLQSHVGRRLGATYSIHKACVCPVPETLRCVKKRTVTRLETMSQYQRQKGTFPISLT